MRIFVRSVLLFFVLGVFFTHGNLQGGDPELDEKLLQAAEAGNAAEVQSLLQNGANVNTTDKDGNTPLLIAASKGHKEIVEALLNSGANVNTTDQNDETPLHIAAYWGRKDAVETLLKTPGIDVNKVDKDGYTPLFMAAYKGNAEVVKLLLNTPGIDVNKVDKDGHTPLFMAAYKGNAEVVKLLLNTPGIDVNKVDKDGQTPLFMAASWGHKEIVEMLLNAPGIDVNLADKYGKTPLFIAAEKENTKVVKLLLKAPGIDVNLANEKGQTPLFMAAYKGNAEVVKLLLKAPGIDVNKVDKDGKTPLFIAAKKGRKEVVEALLNAPGIDVNKVDKDGKTPLFIAAAQGHKEIVEALLKVPGIEVNKPKEYGQTPLYVAAYWGRKEVVEALLKAPGIDVNLADKDGKTPLFIAAEKENTEVVKLLLNTPGIDVNKVDKDGQTPLFMAASWGHKEIVEMLLNAPGIDVNKVDKDGHTPLFIAAYADHTDIANLLLEKINLKIPEYSCFLTFTQNEEYTSVVNALKQALFSKIIVICNRSIIQAVCLGRKDVEKPYAGSPFIADQLISKKWSLFVSGTNLVVIIPEQGKVEELSKKYGFKKLKEPESGFLESLQTAEVPTTINEVTPDKLIEEFKGIIDKDSPEHPTRFFLDGHGGENTLANMPFTNDVVNKFLTAMTEINAQFLYVLTCNAGGRNIVKLQEYLEGMLEKPQNGYLEEKSESALKERLRQEFDTEEDTEAVIPYIIVLQATTDIVISGIEGEFNTFFTKLNELFVSKKANVHAKYESVRSGDPKALSDVLKYIVKGGKAESLTSVRFPGTMSFFRVADLGNMDIITEIGLQALRLGKKLGPIFIEGKPEQAATSGAKELIDLNIKPDSKFIQIFPYDMRDINMTILGTSIPKFISKIPGMALHFIGKISYECDKNPKDKAKDLDEFVNEGFKIIYERKAGLTNTTYRVLTNKYWFIKELELRYKDTTHIFNNLIINLSPDKDTKEIDYIYSGQTPENIKFMQKVIDDIQIIKWQDLAKSFLEATGKQKTPETFKTIRKSVRDLLLNYIFWDQLYLAVIWGRAKAVKKLLKAGADVNETYSNGTTPLYLATQTGYVEVVKALLDAGADKNMKYLNKTPLEIAIEAEQKAPKEKQKAYQEIINLLKSEPNVSENPFYAPVEDSEPNVNENPFYAPVEDSEPNVNENPFYAPVEDSEPNVNENPFYAPVEDSEPNVNENPFYAPVEDSEPNVNENPFYAPVEDSELMSTKTRFMPPSKTRS